jgi:recombination protein RecA
MPKTKKKTKRIPKQKTREDLIREMRAKHSTDSQAPAPMTAAATPPVAISKAKIKKLDELSAKLKKKYKGDDVITTIANGSRATNIHTVPSGWPEMDDLITGETDANARTVPGTGLGWPRGRIIEIYGEESVGKTSTALQIIAAFQRAGETCAFIDAEHALDVSYAAKLGVDLTSLKLVQPDSGGERAMDIVHEMSASGLFGCIVVDSVSALVPESEMEADFEENVQPARQAALMSRALRKLTGVVSKRDVLLIFINQIRIKIGVRFGNPKTTSGGQALKFYASVRIELTNMKTMRKGDRVTGRRIRIRTVKNKVAPPFRDLYADLVPNKGIAAVYGDPDFAGGTSDE